MAKQKKIIGRIRYEKNWNNDGEYYVFEWKYEDEDENQWTTERAAKLYNFGEYKDMIHYTALTQIREWNKIGIRDIYWK